MFDNSQFKTIDYREVPPHIAAHLRAMTEHDLCGPDRAEAIRLTADAWRLHGAGVWESYDEDGEPVLCWLVPRLQSLTLWGTTFYPTHTGVSFALEAIREDGARILVTDSMCEDYPTARDWIVTTHDDGDNIIAEHVNAPGFTRHARYQPIDNAGMLADLFAGIPSPEARIACVYGL